MISYIASFLPSGGGSRAAGSRPPIPKPKKRRDGPYEKENLPDSLSRFADERRQNPRFTLSGVVIVVTHPPAIPPGRVKEISRAGLSYHYHGNGSRFTFPKTIDLIWADFVNTYHLEQIPVRLVADTALTPTDGYLETANRWRTVVFENLPPHQEAQIDRLIRSRGTILH